MRQPMTWSLAKEPIALFVIVVAVSVLGPFGVLAQQAPRGGLSEPRSSGVTTQAPAALSAEQYEQLKTLLNAQTSAIKAMSARLDAVENRLNELESMDAASKKKKEK